MAGVRSTGPFTWTIFIEMMEYGKLLKLISENSIFHEKSVNFPLGNSIDFSNYSEKFQKSFEKICIRVDTNLNCSHFEATRTHTLHSIDAVFLLFFVVSSDTSNMCQMHSQQTTNMSSQHKQSA